MSNPRTFVVGDRPEVAEVEPNNTPEQGHADRRQLGGRRRDLGGHRGRLLRVRGQEGPAPLLDLQAERIDSRLDATLRLLDPSNKELAESRDVFGTDPFLDVTLPADGRYVIKVHDAVYAGSPDHVYRLTVHDGPHLDAILPLAAQPGDRGSLHADRPRPRAGRRGRRRGEGRRPPAWNAWPSRSVAPEARPIETIRSRLWSPPAGVALGRALEYALVRPDAAGAAPVVSNPVFVARAIGPVVLEQEPNHDEAQPQMVVPPCDISGTFGVPGDVDLYRFQGKKGDVWIIEAIAERLGRRPTRHS